jgi:hypothetical protein
MKLENFEILKFFAMFYTLYHTCIFKQESIQGMSVIHGRGMINGRHLTLYQIFKTTVFTTKYMINIDILLIWSTIKNLEPKMVLFMPLKRYILHLYDHIRQPCYSEEAKELTCPKPTVPKKEIYLTNQDQRGKEKGLFFNFTVFLLARSNTHDIPFSNILISKKPFLCNKYMLSGCELIDTENISLPNQNMKFLASERSEQVTSFIFCRAG